MNCISLKEQKGKSKMNCISLKEQKGEVKMKRGFTLIELMIVISVMAILIGISLPYFKGMQDEGNSAKAAGELRTLATAIESFYIHNGEYPVESEAVNITYDWQTDTDSLTDATPTIVLTALNDPFDSAQEYSYLTSEASGSKYYVVFSVGPDGDPNIATLTTAGVIAAPGDDIYITNAASGVGGF